ncbi:MAG TPA: hypothetical protein PKL73_16760 [Polyangiaceae bacterium]|nr:MAG: hypothetical protein BWY17_04765 [Deltaproteobacteria bacterium ADurb.Bin207]HNS98607.1 hypothetical protein [Polyangiaceae bacterium]HNZ25470.1 hypothetical protein [Polyangiaceae bacterium]HOD25209.1 hypothetical protein [Polyangiaceae bacterium]HOH03690.1 hypothetical protein [Polyangiaceae bacterium]
MPERQFFQPEARTKVRDAIVAIEAQTSAEVVVAVRRQSCPYRHIDVGLGSLASFISLLLLLFLPWDFAVSWMPVEVLIAFGVGFALSTVYWAPKRWLVGSSKLHETSWRAACTAFHENGISRTSGRNGLLVFVSMLERRVHVVTDIGIDPDGLGAAWQESLAAMQQAVDRTDFESFLQALLSIGPVLGAAMPHAEDDVNELPDEPDMS